VQLAKNCFGAGKVITTLSTGKMGKVGELLGEGAPDVCVDYTKGKGEVVKEVGKGSVDFMFDTQGYTLSALSVMRHGGQIVSISTVPNGTEFRKKNEGMPAWLVWVMDLADWGLKWWTGLGGVGYEYLVMQGKREDLERLKGWVEEGKVKPVVGSVVKMEDIRGVREGCQRILEGKGGVGKFVVEVE
jgi:NADPH:quinone reductase-like Zn-dependent oxidoreductase